MNKILTGLILCVLFFPASSQEDLIQKIYVGTYTSEGAEGIYLCRFDGTTGEISLEKTFKGVEDPSFLTISPDRKHLFAVTRASSENEKPGGYVNAYRIQPDGELEFINKQISHGAGPCHVDVSPNGKYVAIATYSSGTTSLYGVNEDGSLKPASSTIVNQGSGPDKARQSAPHAHSIRFSRDGSQAFSADLGTDQLNIFDVKKGELIPARQPFVKMAPGAGPRHFDFHPNNKVIYVINELNSTITSFKKNGKTWEELQTISTLPEDFTKRSYCADIHVSPDGRYLYGSNRGHNSIAVFKIDNSTQMLEWQTSVSTEGDWPRNFVLSPDGKFMLVANQKSGNIVVFTINKETGLPVFSGKELALPSPVCLDFL
ncbi:lactonase family protein [Mariniphaga sediminis]|uniref:lactonase family protein n=1 Tax=Mariniphaga sediminis TaxID=1628158 RepID=UPI003562B069